MKGKIQILLSIGMLCTLLLAACAPAAVPTAVPATEAPAATEAPMPTEAPTEVPTAALTGQTLMTWQPPPAPRIRGCLDYLLPFFTQETGIGFNVVAVGSGQALQLGKDGNADVLLVHSPAAEKEFMAAGDGIRREDVMYNDFRHRRSGIRPGRGKECSKRCGSFQEDRRIEINLCLARR